MEGGDYEQVEWDGKVEMKEGGVEGGEGQKLLTQHPQPSSFDLIMLCEAVIFIP